MWFLVQITVAIEPQLTHYVACFGVRANSPELVERLRGYADNETDHHMLSQNPES